MKEYKFKINGNEYNVSINSVEGKNASVTVNGAEYIVEMEEAPACAPVESAPVTQTQPSPVAARSEAPKATGNSKPVTSPLPGVIISVKVNVGDVVKAGQVIAILEAMKMENEIQAESDGVISSVNVSKGDSVLEGATIVTIG